VDRGDAPDLDRQSQAVGGLDPIDAERAVAVLVIYGEQRRLARRRGELAQLAAQARAQLDRRSRPPTQVDRGESEPVARADLGQVRAHLERAHDPVRGRGRHLEFARDLGHRPGGALKCE
jgi:hypothetical protein